MDEKDFEGTLVLEKLAEFGQVEAFFGAVDADDFVAAKLLMARAGIDEETIEMVLQKMVESDD